MTHAIQITDRLGREFYLADSYPTVDEVVGLIEETNLQFIALEMDQGQDLFIRPEHIVSVRAIKQ